MKNGDAQKNTAALSLMEQVKALDEQRARLIDGAKAEALKKIDEAINELAGLGFKYRLIDDEGSPSRPTKNSTFKAASGDMKITRPMKDKICETCGFKTTPLHDGRAHRSQKSKAPFTHKELEALKLVRVGESV